VPASRPLRRAAQAGATLLCAALGVVGAAGAAARQHAQPDLVLETYRTTGDQVAQRRHAWSLVARLTRTTAPGTDPAFTSWPDEDEVFANARQDGTGAVPARAGAHASAEAPVITRTFYNDAAAQHIRRHRLQERASLERLRSQGPADEHLPGMRSVPLFPAEAIVLKTAWWPVAPQGLAPLPVWDPGLNAVRRGGTDHTRWSRVVALDPIPSALGPVGPAGSAGTTGPARLEFAGRAFPAARRIPLDATYHVVLDGPQAARLMRDARSNKAARLVLGRPLVAGDVLALVAVHLATREISNWIWVTLWWHDTPDAGGFAAGRPAGLAAPWRHFLLDVAFDAVLPTTREGKPHISFNPWLEARFPDGGQGGGTVSNCLACHQRASYPSVGFLPVTRGAPQLTADPAFAAGQLRTHFLWSIPLRAAGEGMIPPPATHRSIPAE
jgi:hypothetical protein